MRIRSRHTQASGRTSSRPSPRCTPSLTFLALASVLGSTLPLSIHPLFACTTSTKPRRLISTNWTRETAFGSHPPTHVAVCLRPCSFAQPPVEPRCRLCAGHTQRNCAVMSLQASTRPSLSNMPLNRAVLRLSTRLVLLKQFLALAKQCMIAAIAPAAFAWRPRDMFTHSKLDKLPLVLSLSRRHSVSSPLPLLARLVTS